MGYKKLLTAYKDWVIPVTTGALFPWQDKLSTIELISGYYQPWTNFLVTVLSPIGALAGYALLNDGDRSRIRRWLVWAIVLSVICLVVTVLLNFTLGRSWYPTGSAMYAARLAWWFGYVGTFIFLTQVVLCAVMLMQNDENGGQTPPSPPPPPDP